MASKSAMKKMHMYCKNLSKATKDNVIVCAMELKEELGWET
jgi:hypothetical protein